MKNKEAKQFWMQLKGVVKAYEERVESKFKGNMKNQKEIPIVHND